MNAELEARLWSLEAERLRPVPPKPPSTGMDRRAIERYIDTLVALGLDDEDEHGSDLESPDSTPQDPKETPR